MLEILLNALKKNNTSNDRDIFFLCTVCLYVEDNARTKDTKARGGM